MQMRIRLGETWLTRALREFPGITLFLRGSRDPVHIPEVARVREVALQADRIPFNAPQEFPFALTWLEASNALSRLVVSRLDDATTADPDLVALYNANAIEYARLMRWLHYRGLRERIQISNRRAT